MEVNQAQIWGEVYEIAAKRGVIMSLVDEKLLSASHPLVTEWISKKLIDVYAEVKKTLYGDVINAKIKENIESYFQNLIKCAYGQGYTNTREFLRKIKPKSKLKDSKLNWSLSGIWCPLTMPNESTRSYANDYSTEEEKAAIEAYNAKCYETFSTQFQLNHADIFSKGAYGRSDFLAVIRVGLAYHVLVQEYSLFYVMDEPELYDRNDPCTYLHEYKRYIKHSESQSVFSYVNAEAQEVPFKFSKTLRKYLKAFVRKEKVLFKIAQGCSYATQFIEAYKYNLGEESRNRVKLYVVGLTSRGSEYISAEYSDKNKSAELQIMLDLGNEYRIGNLSLEKLEEKTKLQTEMLGLLVNDSISNISHVLKQNISDMTIGNDLTFEITEELKGFVNPNEPLTLDTVNAWIDEYGDEDEQKAKLKTKVESQFHEIRKGKHVNKSAFTLRDLHNCAVVQALEESKIGQINWICLTGTPGIGKTSSVKTLLKDLEGFFFFYTSPRVLINDDVVGDLSKISATLTSNSDVVTQAKEIYKEIHQKQCEINARGAAIVGGINQLKVDESSNILLFKQDDYRKMTNLEQSRSSNRRYNNTSEAKVNAQNKKMARVFDSLGKAACQVIECHPEVNKLTMTVASQAFSKYSTTASGPRNPREVKSKQAAVRSSLEGLNHIFKYKIDQKPTEARIERANFAKKFPNIVVMFDEITGDSGCRSFINEMRNFLSKNFIDPFDGNSPFTITIILADASLSNVNAIQNYMKKVEQLPAKMFISPALGGYPFKMQTADIFTGVGISPSIHVMANCYPASELKIQYIMKQYAVLPETDEYGVDVDLTQLFRKEAGDRTQQTALELIVKQLEEGKKQIIYFAQDKRALSELKSLIVDQGIMDKSKVGIFDSQLVGYHRTELLSQKEELRIVLITSTAARGISFPNCDSIIATMPRFSVEASLMEIAQLVYRGRGGYEDKVTKTWVNGDQRDRLLTILVEDFYLASTSLDQTQLEFKVKNSLDMLSIFMLIRGTLLTRIQGEAGFKKASIAMIPIGEVKDKENEKLGLASLIRDFIKETNDFISKVRSTDGGLVGRLKAIVDKAQILYSSNKLTSTYSTKTNRFRSFYTPLNKGETSEIQFYEKWCRDHHSLKSKLISINEDENTLVIPENIYFSGPMILEDRGNFGNKESFGISNDNDSQVALKILWGELIAVHQGFPQLSQSKNLLKYIREIIDMITALLNSDTDSYEKEVEQQGQMRKLWLVYPVAANELVKIEDKSFDKDWFSALRFELKTRNAEFPVVPEFKDHPFRGTQQLSGHPLYENLFERTDFMMCRELNLVNAITMFND